MDVAQETPLNPEDIAPIGIAGTEPVIITMSGGGGGIMADPEPRLPAEYDFHIAASQLAAAGGVGHLQGVISVISLEDSSGTSLAAVASPPRTSEESGGVDLLLPSVPRGARVGSGGHKSFWGRLGLGSPRSSTLIKAGMAVVGLGVAALAVGGALRGAKPRSR
jgi:hypothetical protein